jgi:hypothetical protein
LFIFFQAFPASAHPALYQYSTWTQARTEKHALLLPQQADAPHLPQAKHAEVFLVVLMPDELALKLVQLHILPIELSDS